MYKSINFHDHQITELQQAIKKLQADKTKQSDEPDKKVMTQVNMSRAGGGLTLITVQVFNGDELVNVITTTSTTAHFNGENIKIIKDKEVETFGTKGDK
ncbi:hypothetical protein [Weissella hellenica]|uniref:hypothetical protein n=1 Tax=Weissella hellenica TaxID=46256 RepID=UPI003889F8A4